MSIFVSTFVCIEFIIYLIFDLIVLIKTVISLIEREVKLVSEIL